MKKYAIQTVENVASSLARKSTLSNSEAEEAGGSATMYNELSLVIIAFAREPDDEMVDMLRAALAAEGATPEPGKGEGKLKVNQTEWWMAPGGWCRLTNHECGVELEALSSFTDAVRERVSPRPFSKEELQLQQRQSG